MNLVGAAVVPSAPILLPGVSQAPPAELEPVAGHVARILAALPAHEVLVLLAAAGDGAPAGIHVGAHADLGGLSRPDLRAPLRTPPHVVEAVAAACGLSAVAGPPPVDLATLLLQAERFRRGGSPAAVVAVAVPWDFGEATAALGAKLLAALPADAGPVVAVAAGDLSAGLTEKAPRHLVPGAAEWDAAAVDALERGDVAALAELGPQEARRVASRSWPALTALLGGLDGLGLRLDCVYAAPRGVGYVVGST